MEGLEESARKRVRQSQPAAQPDDFDFLLQGGLPFAPMMGAPDMGLPSGMMPQQMQQMGAMQLPDQLLQPARGYPQPQLSAQQLSAQQLSASQMTPMLQQLRQAPSQQAAAAASLAHMASAATAQSMHHRMGQLPPQMHQAPPAAAAAAPGPLAAHMPPAQIPAALAPFANPEDKLKAIVRDYLELQRRNESRDQTIIIMNSRVVQKSYGNEKRFFCPPPCVILEGKAWLQHPEGLPAVFVMMGDVPADQQRPTGELIDLESNSFGLARNLFISDQDRRKSFCLQFKLFYKKERDVGSFLSRPMKVISKPSKKKQSVANADMCIECGTCVSLFNRVRAQAGSTRYLVREMNVLRTDTRQWGTFIIRKYSPDIEDGKLPDPMAPRPATPTHICYGNEIVLQCSTTGALSHVYVVRKVDKNNVFVNGDDPVSQLQKVAFYLKGSERMYMGLTDDDIADLPGRACQTDASQDIVGDSCTWTICSCDRAVYTFCEPPGQALPYPVNPVPIVQYIKCLGPMVEIYGENFTTLLKVWFDDVPAETFYRCEELLLCRPPDISLINGTSDKICRERKNVSLLLVRDDGVIYRTNHNYTYEVDHMALIREAHAQGLFPAGGRLSASPAQ